MTNIQPDCFHCGLPVPPDSNFIVEVLDRPWAMCCRGCQAVAQAIVDAGLQAYYRHRTQNAHQAPNLDQPMPGLEAFDHPAVQKSFVKESDGSHQEVALLLNGTTCAACVWLNEQRLSALPGVLEVDANYMTQCLRVRWDITRLKLSAILRAVRELGYDAQPYHKARGRQAIDGERDTLLRRIGVAGVFGMQVMMLSAALYFGDWSGIDDRHRELLQRVALLLTVPVIAYSAQPFFVGAVNGIKTWRVGMDVPIAIGIGLAFVASIWATATNVGHVYYDSIVMLVFLLLGARYFEVASRKRAFESVDRINSHVPPTANRWSDAGLESVPAVQLTAGDRVLIRPGETVPADGKVIDGYSTVDESLLTGESAPVTRCVGDQVVGGSINVETPLSVVVTALGDASVMATVQRLIDRAQSTKPTLVTVTDRLAVVFVTVVLVLAASAGIFWWYADSNRWLEITVAMLVVSCPCALSLATPTTFTAALLRLYRGGVLPVRNSALETLARADHIVFDKTGTLTAPEVHLHSLSATSGMSRDRLIRYAAALEVHSAHPIAVAIRRIAQGVELPTVTEPRATPGGGVSGIVDGRRIAIGTARYVGDQLGLGGDIVEPPHGVVLATETGVIGRFDFDGDISADTVDAIDKLGHSGATLHLLTGDTEAEAQRVGQRLGIEQVSARCTPREKLKYIHRLQAAGGVVVMVGDGVNDAPALAGADVSIAVADAATLAAANADIVITNHNLSGVVMALAVARRALRVVRQNIIWAIGYNCVALLAAAAGFVAPWLAAVGMATSSALVTANAWRVGGDARRRSTNCVGDRVQKISI